MLELELDDLIRTVTTVARDDKLTQWSYEALQEWSGFLLRKSADKCNDLADFKHTLSLFKNPELTCVGTICAFASVVHQKKDIPIIDLCRTIADWLKDEGSEDNDSRGKGTVEGEKSQGNGGPNRKVPKRQ